MTTTKKYIDWITQDPELTKNATLFMILHTENNYYKRAKGPDTRVLFPPGIIESDSLSWGEVQSSLDQLAKPYVALMEKAKQLPALGTRGMAYYDLCDQMWKLGEQLPIHEGIAYDRGYRGQDRVADQLTISPAQAARSSLSNVLELVLSTGIAHTILEDIPTPLQQIVWEYQQDRQLYPHQKLDLVLNQKDLTREQLIMIGKKLQAIDLLVSRTMMYNGMKEQEQERNKKWEHGLVMDEGVILDIQEFESTKLTNASELSHCLKNVYNPMADLLRQYCSKLGIRCAEPFQKEMLKSGAKSRRDTTLFD